MENKTATLSFDDTSIDLPIIEGTEGERAVDISKLRGATGLITLDPGYVNTGACKSAVTFLNGEKGILRHRGYSIDYLADNHSFVEVAWLLIYGTLPTETETQSFKDLIKKHYDLDDSIRSIIENYPVEAHPMALLASCTVALSGLYGGVKESTDEEVLEIVARLMGKFIGIAAFAYRKSKGKEFIEPDTSLDYCENFLNMMYDEGEHDDEMRSTIAKALNRLLIIHGDHEQNCSTSTVRIVSSSNANIYASVASGICALWGPLHGGANQAVMEMLQEINETDEDIESTLARAKDKSDPFRLMGFGHRVYKTYDPRAKIAKASCDEFLEKLQGKEDLVETAIQLEAAALADDYFKDRNLYPNVDFYTGIIYRAMGIPTELFTVLFAIGRLPGWIAHLLELRVDPDKKIGRPRQIYTGANEIK